eukprot:7318161-Alexandrium_andersonii.AAC.1
MCRQNSTRGCGPGWGGQGHVANDSRVAPNDDCHGAEKRDTPVQAPTRAQQRQIRKHVDAPTWPAYAARQTQSPDPGTRPAPHAARRQDVSAGPPG